MSDEQSEKPDIAQVTHIVARKPSNETQAEEAPKPSEAPSLAEAVRALIPLIKAHRTAGDSDLEAAVADVEAALASWGT